MVTWVDNTLQLAFRARWLTGPIFDKELRVASRQRKYYLLRFVYVCLLALVTVQFWYTMAWIGGGASGVAQVSRLSAVGRSAIAAIIWFQFVTAQVLATVLLSDAISSELRQRTLEGLLATPLGAVHIVLGKLFSKLLQVVLLLALSLPVLAVARVFGGVPWDYVVSGVCITLSASVFAGALSLLCSITRRHAYQVVLVVGLWYLVVWGLVTLTTTALSAAYSGSARAAFVLSLVNPISALMQRTPTIARGAGGASAAAPLVLHCLVLLGAAALLLALAVRRVRRVALAPGRAALRSPMTHRPGLRSLFANPIRMSQAVRRVDRAPIVWKDMCTPLFQARRQAVLHVGLWLALGGFFLFAVISTGSLNYRLLFLPIQVLQLFFLLRLGVTAAGAITREKEARTWPILLATPLEDREIVKGKAVAALRKNLALLVPLFLLYLLIPLVNSFWAYPPRSVVWLFSTYVSLAGTIVFLLGVGLYLSTRLKSTTGAVVSTLALYFVPRLLFCGTPLPWFLLTESRMFSRSTGAMWIMTFVPPVVFAGIGVACLRAASQRLRRNVF
jgi:ABC-type transport system involved in multi-copper enzyme maturation permease subunit